ncbi:hypothetical protein ACQKP1_25215 [Allorhizobium sp. NPDC080224]|uniref:hypothetical protein n=1 Tax=Allorhizobium sp. NPDC080224 TaxID=3390547 RepID=UPI003D049A78
MIARTSGIGKVLLDLQDGVVVDVIDEPLRFAAFVALSRTSNARASEGRELI